MGLRLNFSSLSCASARWLVVTYRLANSVAMSANFAELECVFCEEQQQCQQELFVRDLSLFRIVCCLTPDRLKLSAWIDFGLLEEVRSLL